MLHHRRRDPHQRMLLTMPSTSSSRVWGKVPEGSTLFLELPKFPYNTHTHTFNGPLSGTTQVSRYQKRKNNLDFTEARDSEWQWHPLGHMHVCTSLQTDNHASTPPLSFLQAGCPSCRPTNSVKAMKAGNFLTTQFRKSQRKLPCQKAALPV